MRQQEKMQLRKEAQRLAMKEYVEKRANALTTEKVHYNQLLSAAQQGPIQTTENARVAAHAVSPIYSSHGSSDSSLVPVKTPQNNQIVQKENNTTVPALPEAAERRLVVQSNKPTNSPANTHAVMNQPAEAHNEPVVVASVGPQSQAPASQKSYSAGESSDLILSMTKSIERVLEYAEKSQKQTTELVKEVIKGYK